MRKKTTGNLKLRDILFFKSVKVMKGKGKLRNSQRPEEKKRHDH